MVSGQNNLESALPIDSPDYGHGVCAEKNARKSDILYPYHHVDNPSRLDALCSLEEIQTARVMAPTTNKRRCDDDEVSQIGVGSDTRCD